MRVLYITQANLSASSGEATHSREVIRALTDLGHRVDLFCVGGTGDLDLHESHEFRWGTGNFGRILFQVWLVWKLARLEQPDYDFVYVRQAPLMFAPSLMKRSFGGSLVLEFNTIFSRTPAILLNRLVANVIGRIESLALRRSDSVLVISELLKNEFLNAYPNLSDKFAVIENGCNTDLMRPLDRQECRDKHGVDAQTFVVGFVGHLHPWQGVGELLKAFALHIESFPDSLLLIAGDSTDSESYVALATRLGVMGCVRFLGSVPYQDVPEVLGACDVAVAPGPSADSFDYKIRSPLKVYEYLACGRPVIAGRLQTLERLFEDSRIGILTEPGDVEAISAALSYLVKHPGEAADMGKCARLVAEQSLSWASKIGEIVALAKSQLPGETLEECHEPKSH